MSRTFLILNIMTTPNIYRKLALKTCPIINIKLFIILSRIYSRTNDNICVKSRRRELIIKTPFIKSGKKNSTKRCRRISIALNSLN